ACMKRSLEELEAIVRRQICAVCSDRTVDQHCGLENPGDCALFRLFPEVAEAIASTSSDYIQDYVDAIRRRVCAVCFQQEADGNCNVRNEVRCALDAYLPLVAAAIEEATGKELDRTSRNEWNGTVVELVSLAPNHAAPQKGDGMND